MKKRMRMVDEARQPGIRLGAQPAAGRRRAIERESAQAAAGEVALQDERIMPGAKKEDVVVGNA